MSDPKAVLAEHGMDVPDGMDVKVVENADNCVHITMPAPPSGSMELSDEELSNAAGGVVTDAEYPTCATTRDASFVENC
jgi:hypothetical protein